MPVSWRQALFLYKRSLSSGDLTSISAAKQQVEPVHSLTTLIFPLVSLVHSSFAFRCVYLRVTVWTFDWSHRCSQVCSDQMLPCFHFHFIFSVTNTRELPCSAVSCLSLAVGSLFIRISLTNEGYNCLSPTHLFVSLLPFSDIVTYLLPWCEKLCTMFGLMRRRRLLLLFFGFFWKH